MKDCARFCFSGEMSPAKSAMPIARANIRSSKVSCFPNCEVVPPGAAIVPNSRPEQRFRRAICHSAIPPAGLGSSGMSSMSSPDPIRIGVASEEPIRLTGLTSIFDQPAREGRPPLVPLAARLEELLENLSLGYLVVDLQSSSSGLEVLETIRRSRPDLRLIVIGPANDELIMDSIIAGARAYLSLTADPETVFKAI